MALNTVYLPKVDGLQTESSNINSDPRSLADCVDVISNRNDFLEPRHGHPSAPKGVPVPSSTATDLYAYRNQTAKIYTPIYKVSGKFQFKVISQSTGEEITSGSTETGTMREIDNISTIRTSRVNLRPTTFAHDERLLFLTDYGLYFRPYSTPDANATKVDFPVIRTMTVEPMWITTSPTYASDIAAENNHWLVPGFQSNFRIVFEIEAKEGSKGERRLASTPSRIYEVKNFNLNNTATTNRTPNMLVDIAALTISHTPPAGTKLYAKIYRTKQFLIGKEPITEYHLAAPEIEVSSTTITVGYITVNDDSIGTLEPLYNDSSQGGFVNTNHLPLPAKNVTQFRNYYIYSNLSLPVLTTFGVTGLPGPENTLAVKISGVAGVSDKTHTITFKTSGASSAIGGTADASTSEINIPANTTTLSNTYIREDNTSDLTFRGLRATPALNAVVRIKPGTSQGEVESYGKITKVQFINKNGNNAVVRVTSATSGFDINRFAQPGIAAIVDANGRIQVLFSYSNYRRIAASLGFIDFEGAVSVGAPMPADQTASLTMYYIPGESIANLDIYKGTTSYFSLLPCKNGLPFPIAKPAPVSNDLYRYSNSATLSTYSYDNGTTTVTINTVSNHGFSTGNIVMISSSISGINGLVTLATASGSTFTFVKDINSGAVPSGTSLTGYALVPTNSDLVINPDYLGPLTKPQGKLLDDLALAIADKIQQGVNETSAIITLNGGDRLEDGIVTAEILDNRYEKIEFIRTGADIYEPTINTSYTEFAASEKSVSSFIISKENNPELIPFGGTGDIAGPYEPPKVGDPNKAIVATAATKDSIYLLKEDGVARVFIGFNALVPLIQGINVFDNTTFCVSSGSVQVLNDSVLFLAQNGVHAISGNNIDKVSRQIETELKKAISQCKNAEKLDDIRSFSNGAKGLYGLHIPLAGTSYVTYVLNIQTMRWTKWSNTINGAVVDQEGRLTTLTTDLSGNYIRQDKYTGGDPRAEVDQVDDEFTATSASDVGLVRTLTATGLGDKSYRFGSKKVYYKSGSSLLSVTVVRTGVNTVDVTFTSTPPTFSVTDVLTVGVNMMVEFQPFTANNPSELKMFSGFHIHTEESVLDMAVSFRTEARSTFSVVKNFSVSPDNRTVYRCFIPLESVRGRFLYRKITHTRPYQICAIPSQAIIFRNTASERVQKSQ